MSAEVAVRSGRFGSEYQRRDGMDSHRFHARVSGNNWGSRRGGRGLPVLGLGGGTVEIDSSTSSIPSHFEGTFPLGANLVGNPSMEQWS